MSGKPKPISAKTREAWGRGDVPTAERLSGLKERRLRDRLGAPGSGPATGPAAPPAPSAASPPQKLVRVPSRATAPTSPAPAPPVELTVPEIERVNTREEAEAIYRDVKAKLGTADEVRYSPLVEKALAALNRIEQIDKRRPVAPAPDEVQEALRVAMAESTEHLLRHTAPAAERWAKLLPRLRVALGIAAPELLRELDTLTGGPTT